MTIPRRGVTEWLDLIGEEARVMWRVSPDILLRLNIDGTIGQVNPAWTRWLGHALEEVIDLPLSQFIVAGDLLLVSQAIQQLKSSDLTHLIRFRMITKDGSHIPMGVRGSSFNGRGRSYLIFRPAYMAQEYEHQIEVARRRGLIDFEQLIEAAPNGIIVIDIEANIALVNRQIEAIFKYDRSELVEQPLSILIPDALRTRHSAHIQDYMSAPELRVMGSELDLKGRSKDGTLIDLEIGLSALTTADGLRVIAITREVGAKRMLQREAQRQRDQFEALLLHSMIGVLLVDNTGYITYASPMAVEMLGGTSILGKMVQSLIAEEHHRYWEALFERVRSEPDGRRRLVLRWRMKEGVLYQSFITHLWNSPQGVVLNLWEIDRLGLP